MDLFWFRISWKKLMICTSTCFRISLQKQRGSPGLAYTSRDRRHRKMVVNKDRETYQPHWTSWIMLCYCYLPTGTLNKTRRNWKSAPWCFCIYANCCNIKSDQHWLDLSYGPTVYCMTCVNLLCFLVRYPHLQSQTSSAGWWRSKET